MNERGWVLVGHNDREDGLWQVQLRRPVDGEPASVEADWRWTLAHEEEHGDVVGFAHTHPAGAGNRPSSRDVRTMKAWCTALGKPLLCLIAEGEELVDPAGYLFADDESDAQPFTSFEILAG